MGKNEMSNQQIIHCQEALPNSGMFFFTSKAHCHLSSHPKLKNHLPLISIIVPTHNNEDTLPRCLDSALVQNVERMEIIVVDDASTDTTPDILAAYVRRYPGIVRSVRFSENMGPGPARNTGISMALGRYLTFIDSDDMLSEHFLKDALNVIEKEKADIVAFDVVTYAGTRKTIWGVEPGSWSGETSLRQFLFKKTGSYAGWGRLYRASLIYEHAITYASTVVHQDIFFSIQAFYYSRKTIVVRRIGYLRTVRNGSQSGTYHNENQVYATLNFIQFLNSFFQKHGLNLDSEMYKYCVRTVYSWDRDFFCRSIYEADKKNRLQALLTAQHTATLATCRPFLDCMLTDAGIILRDSMQRPDQTETKRCGNSIFITESEVYAAIENSLSTSQKLLDSDKSYIMSKKCSSCFTLVQQCANIMVHSRQLPSLPQRNQEEYLPVQDDHPLLSVIIPVYNQQDTVERCMRSVLNQSFHSLEILMLDSGSTDNTLTLCQSLQKMDGRIHVKTFGGKRRLGSVRNIGLKLARGKYILFMNGDDYLPGDFLLHGITALEHESNIDVIHLASFENNDKKNIDKNVILQKVTGDEAFRDYINGGCIVGIDSVRNIIRHEVLLNNDVTFKEHFYVDTLFLLRLFSCSRNVICMPYVLYNKEKITTKEELTRVINISFIRQITTFLKRYSGAMLFFITNCKYCLTQFFHYMQMKYKKFNNHRVLHYLNKYSNSTSSHITDKDIILLQQYPPILRILLEKYADAWAASTKYMPALPKEDVDPCAHRKPPADYLIPVTFYPNAQPDILLSIIIPAFRVSNTLERCLESVLKQRTKNIEIILVEDSSDNDTTYAVAEHYAQRHSVIRLFRTPWNSGLGTVRNLALRTANGKYITYLDSDDWMAPDFLQYILPILSQTPNWDVARFSYNEWDDCANTGIRSNVMPYDLTVNGSRALDIYITATYKIWAAWAAIYKKTFLLNQHILFGSGYNEDEIFLLQAYSKASSVQFYNISALYHVTKAVLPTIMNPSCRGGLYFHSSVENLHNTYTFLKPLVESHGINLQQYMERYIYSHHKINLLSYIYACNKLGLPSPLTDEVLAKIAISPEYLRAMLNDYAKLYENLSQN